MACNAQEITLQQIREHLNDCNESNYLNLQPQLDPINNTICPEEAKIKNQALSDYENICIRRRNGIASRIRDDRFEKYWLELINEERKRRSQPEEFLFIGDEKEDEFDSDYFESSDEDTKPKAPTTISTDNEDTKPKAPTTISTDTENIKPKPRIDISYYFQKDEEKRKARAELKAKQEILKHPYKADELFANFMKTGGKVTGYKTTQIAGCGLNVLVTLGFISREKAKKLLIDLELEHDDFGRTIGIPFNYLLKYIQPHYSKKLSEYKIDVSNNNAILSFFQLMLNIPEDNCVIVKLNRNENIKMRPVNCRDWADGHTIIICKQYGKLWTIDPFLEKLKETDSSVITNIIPRYWEQNCFETASVFIYNDVPERIQTNNEKLFKLTYNATYLNFFSNFQLNEIIRNSNYIQKKLIRNLIKKRTDQNIYRYDDIIGPHTIRIFRLKINNIYRTYHIFGESHRQITNDPCQNRQLEPIQKKSRFTDYIKNLAQNSPTFFDLYIENGYIANEDGIMLRYSGGLFAHYYNICPLTDKKEKINFAFQNSFKSLDIRFELGNLLFNFNDCSKSFKTRINKNCKLFRLHLCDTRTALQSVGKPFNLILLHMITNHYYLNHLYKPPLSDEIIYDLFMFGGIVEIFNILTKNNTEYISSENIFNFFLLDNLVKEQYNKTGEFGLHIKNYYLNHFNNLIKSERDFTVMFRQFINQMKKNPNINIQKLKNHKKIVSFISDLNIFDMDLYLLSSLFKNMEIEDPDVDHEPTKSYSSIIYVGDSHAVNYSNFLYYLISNGIFVGNVVYEKNDDYNISCLSIPRDYVRLYDELI